MKHPAAPPNTHTSAYPYPDELTPKGWDRFRAAAYGQRPPIRCQCGGAGFMLNDVEQGHPLWCVPVPCPRCQ